MTIPEEAYASALAHLPGLGASWLNTMLAVEPPSKSWAQVLAGLLVDLSDKVPGARPRRNAQPPWQPWAQAYDVEGTWHRLMDRGIEVVWKQSPSYPRSLDRLPKQAPVLFVAGSTEALGLHPRVAIIGSRNCTDEGAGTAFQMGYELARAGISVVSGLAKGIDGAAHAGAVQAMRDMAEAPPTESQLWDETPPANLTIGVAASGVDVVYPRMHAELWREVTRLGAIVSETPPGGQPQSWRFPERNRIIAGLSDLLVVVESRAQGGSWHTVEAAGAIHGSLLAAVPGSVRSPTSAGTNFMLRYNGALLVRHAEDVIDILVDEKKLERRRWTPLAGSGRSGAELTEPLAPLEQEVARSLHGRPLSVDDLVERCGLPVRAVVLALEQLAKRGVAVEKDGWWSRAR